MKNMKLYIAVALVAAFTFSSCNSNKTKTPALKTQMDSLNYAFGLANGGGIKEYYKINGDSAEQKIAALLDGVKEGMKGEVSKEYAEITDLGTRIGTSLKDQEKSGLMGDSTIKVDIKLIKQGLLNGLKGSNVQMTPEEGQKYLQTTMQVLQTKRMEAQFGPNKKAGEAFLAANAKKPGVITTASGLQYEVIKKGTGALPTDTSLVKVHYHGTLIDGTVFDSSVNRGTPAEFGVNQVIPGWTEVLKLMPVGSKYKVYIPQQLAYGSQDKGNIMPFSTLIFEVELLEIKK